MIARALLLAAMVSASPAFAQPRIEIAPVRLELGHEKPIGSLRLRNTSDAPVAFEVSAMSWAQNNGEDVLTPSESAVVSPPAFVIPPYGQQIVRVGVPTSEGEKEQSLRLLFTERLLNTGAEEEAVRVQLQMSLPVFVAPRSGPAGDGLTIEFAGANGEEKMRVSNPSNQHVVIADTLVGDRKVVLPRYLLAGQSVERAAPAGAAPVSLALVQDDSIVKKEYRFAPASNRSTGGR